MNTTQKLFLSGLFLLCLCKSQAQELAFREDKKFTISGKVKSAKDGEDLIGATVVVKELGTGTVTNVYGFYSLTLPPNAYTLLVSYIGFESQEFRVTLSTNMAMNFDLIESSNTINEVVISGQREDANISEVKMSTINLNIDQVKKLPPLFGEPDIIKIIQMQPGVLSAGEGTSAFFVRGGAADQNLILIDEAPVYDPSHLFGLFSVFNADIIKSSELYKGGIPAMYGGRLSSMMDVRVKEGNSKNLEGTASIGLLAAKASIEAPIVKDKASFLLSGRRSYAGYYMKFSPEEDVRNNNIYFYDLNAKVNYQINDNNRVFVSAYVGRDVMRFGQDFQMDWGNTTGTIRWNRILSRKLFSNTTGIFSNFDYALTFIDDVQGFKWTANIREYSLKQDFSYYLNPSNTMSFGLYSSYKQYSPGRFAPNSANSIFTTTEMQRLNAWDNALYLSNKQEVSPRLSLEYGLRMSIFSNVGPQTVYEYKDVTNLRNVQRIDSTVYGRGDFVKNYLNLEPRLTARFTLNESSSIKGSYNRMSQNAHQMIPGTTPLPISIWLPSGPNIKPQLADQVAIGYFKNLSENMFETSLEVYYKDMRQVLDFADNANVFFNQDLPTVIRPGTSTSYGTEAMVKKVKGKLQGWLSYTWSNTTRDIPGVNRDLVFPASYDRRHSINLVGTYDLNSRWSLGGSWVYGSGRPITLPSGKYQYKHFIVDEYTERNGYRLPDFHRLDLSATLRSRNVVGRKWSSEWSFSLYNAYNRKNPFTIYTRTKRDAEGRAIQGTTEKEAVMIYMFPVLPSISYSIKF